MEEVVAAEVITDEVTVEESKRLFEKGTYLKVA